MHSGILDNKKLALGYKMGLVPVRDVIVRGYTFLFARFFTVLGLGWLPAAFYGIACSYLIRLVGNSAAHTTPANGAFNQMSLGYLLALLVVTAFFGAPLLIPFTREALGMHEEPVAAHFSYGPREWRLFVALLRFYGMVGGALFVLVVASAIGISQLSQTQFVWIGYPAASWLSAVSAFVVLGTLAFLSVRLGFFLGPIAAVEGHAKIARAWSLSRANFWRLAAVYLAVVIPVALIVLIGEYALWGAELDPTNSNAKAIFQLQYDHADGIAAMFAVALMAISALFAASSAAAYSAIDTSVVVSEAEASAPESNWGIHRAPAYADAGLQRIEPHNPEYDPPAYQPAHIEQPAAEPVYEVQHAVQDERFSDAAIEAAVSQAAVAEDVVPVAQEMVHHELAVPAEAPLDPGHALEAEPHAAAHAEGAEPDAAYAAAVSEIPPLDPAGLAQAARPHEAA